MLSGKEKGHRIRREGHTLPRMFAPPVIGNRQDPQVLLGLNATGPHAEPFVPISDQKDSVGNCPWQHPIGGHDLGSGSPACGSLPASPSVEQSKILMSQLAKPTVAK